MPNIAQENRHQTMRKQQEDPRRYKLLHDVLDRLQIGFWILLAALVRGRAHGIHAVRGQLQPFRLPTTGTGKWI